MREQIHIHLRGRATRASRCAPILLVILSQAAWAGTEVGTTLSDAAATAGDREAPSGAPVDWAVKITAESVSNLAGGFKRGTVFDDKVLAVVSLNTGALGLWGGGSFLASVLQISSGLPSQRLVGDIQGVSNIAARSASRVNELWYAHSLGRPRLVVRGGLIDLNRFFAVVEPAQLLINSSFGILPTISADTRASIYPQVGLGLMAGGAHGPWTAQAAVFQGDPAHRGAPFGEGYLAISEVGHVAQQPNPEAIAWKVGLWTRRGTSRSVPADVDGVYAIAERRLDPGDFPPLAFFAQAGWTGGHLEPVSSFLSAGVDVELPRANRPSDHLSIGLARAALRQPSRSPETSWEVAYFLPLLGHLAVQPDLQYVVHPAGRYANALVATLRVRLVAR